MTRFLETKWVKQDLNSITDFVVSQRENNHSVLFALIASSDSMDEIHIGNIKLGPINPYYKHADISYFIGNKSFWGKGIASEAIGLLCQFSFAKLKLHRLEAGAYANAVASWKALERNGFVREGIFKEHVMLDGTYIDVYRYGLISNIK